MACSKHNYIIESEIALNEYVQRGIRNAIDRVSIARERSKLKGSTTTESEYCANMLFDLMNVSTCQLTSLTVPTAIVNIPRRVQPHQSIANKRVILMYQQHASVVEAILDEMSNTICDTLASSVFDETLTTESIIPTVMLVVQTYHNRTKQTYCTNLLPTSDILNPIFDELQRCVRKPRDDNA